MVLALSEKQHKPPPAWYHFVRRVEESTYEENAGQLSRSCLEMRQETQKWNADATSQLH